MKKQASFALVVVLCLVLAVPAFAVELTCTTYTKVDNIGGEEYRSKCFVLTGTGSGTAEKIAVATEPSISYLYGIERVISRVSGGGERWCHTVQVQPDSMFEGGQFMVSWYRWNGREFVEMDDGWVRQSMTAREVFSYPGEMADMILITTLNHDYYVTLSGAVFGLTAYASTQNVLVDGRSVEFPCYALKDEDGNDTNYVKLRDVASVLNGTAAQFNVGWNGSVNIETGKAYTPNGSEMSTPYSGDRACEPASAATNVNGAAAELDAIVLKDDHGNGYTYYKLRDLGDALGFRVDWNAETGIFIETK